MAKDTLSCADGSTHESKIIDDVIERAMAGLPKCHYGIGDRDFHYMVRRLAIPFKRVNGRVFVDMDFGTSTARVFATGPTQEWNVILRAPEPEGGF